MPKSTYILIETDKTFCPNCGRNVELLVSSNRETVIDLPAFYICCRCNSVSQVGVGPVKRGDPERPEFLGGI